MKPEILALAEWLERETESIPYGEAGISVTVHAGKITKISRSSAETRKADVRQDYSLPGKR